MPRLFGGLVAGCVLLSATVIVVDTLVPEPYSLVASMLIGLPVFFATITAFAAPVASRAEGKSCAECGKLNVGYYSWESKVCSGCIDRLEWAKIRGAAPPTPAETVVRPRVADLPSIVERLKTVGTDGDFAVFLFPGRAETSRISASNLQFSIEDGILGVDWVLLEEQNILDGPRFQELAREIGHLVEAREMNDVPYLRVEDGDLIGLAVSVIDRILGYRLEDEVETITEGFEWTPTPR